MNKALLLVVIISVSLIIALAQEPSRPEQGVDPIQPVDPGFAYPNAPDTMDLGTVLVRSLSGHAVDERALFSFITSSASCSRSHRTSGRNQPSPKDPGGIDESIDLSRDR